MSPLLGGSAYPISDITASYSNKSSRPSGDLALTIPIDRTAFWYHLLDFNLAVFKVFFLLLVGTLNFAAPTLVTLLLDIVFTLGSDCCNMPIDSGSHALKSTWKTHRSKSALGIDADATLAPRLGFSQPEPNISDRTPAGKPHLADIRSPLSAILTRLH